MKIENMLQSFSCISFLFKPAWCCNVLVNTLELYLLVSLRCLIVFDGFSRMLTRHGPLESGILVFDEVLEHCSKNEAFH